MKESWLKWEHSIPGHSPEIRVDLWNSSTRGNETVCRRQDLEESFKSHRGMTCSLCLLLSPCMATTLSPRLVPGSATVPKEEKELILSFTQNPLLEDDVKMCLALSCAYNYEHNPCSWRNKRIYGPLPMLRCATSGVWKIEKSTRIEDIAGQT